MCAAPKSIKTPCIGTCSTIYGDTVCRGCSRFQHEIIDWNRYTPNEQSAVWSRIEQVIVTVLYSKVLIPDAQAFKQQLVGQRIRFPEKLDPLVWVNALLNQMERRRLNLSHFDIHLRNPFNALPTPAFHTLIQNEIFELANAFYDQHLERAFRHTDLVKPIT